MTEEQLKILEQQVWHDIPTDLYELSVKILRYAFNNMTYIEDLEDAVLEELDNDLIWTEDQWRVMQTYQTPYEADFNRALDEYANDLILAMQNFLGKINEERR